MNITIPFSKDIVFKTKIAEICSISLEQDVSINENELLGDFIVSGDYKSLDINVDTTPFSYVVPFSVSLDNDIDINSLKYEIYDFEYNVKGDDTLNVVISFHVEADKINDKHEKIFERVEDDLKIDDNVLNDDVTLVSDKMVDEDNNDEILSGNDDVDDERTSAQIITSHELEEDYITYHIHLVKINETIDSISSDFNIDKDELMELNDITTINIGDKLIIPINKDAE